MIRKETPQGGLVIVIFTDEAVIRIRLEGRLDTVSSTFFTTEIQSWVDREEFLIIDLSECSYLASSGIRCLLVASRQLVAKQGALLLASLSDEVQQVLGMTGLDAVLPVFHSVEEAQEETLRRRNLAYQTTGLDLEGFPVSVSLLAPATAPVRIWKGNCLVAYHELGFAIGSGSPAESLKEELTRRGLFITLGKSAGFIPYDSSEPPDFRVVQDPTTCGFFAQWALSANNQPNTIVQADHNQAVSLDQWLDQLCDLARNQGSAPVRAVLCTGETLGKPYLLFGGLGRAEGDFPEVTPFPASLMPFIRRTSGGNWFTGIRFRLSKGKQPPYNEPIENIIEQLLSIENIEDVEQVDLSDLLTQPVAWLFQSNRITGAGITQTEVDMGGSEDLELYQVYLARRLFTDSARIVIRPLHGGYSAQTFQVESYDAAGRKLRPTVMKIGHRDMITREADCCQRYALPYILNNSAIVLGTAFYCNMGALRYNFVGIGGEGSQLKWLFHLYESWPIEDLEVLFDKIFLHILKPWYGQPVREMIHPFRDHDPTLTFFPTLVETAQEVLGIDPEQATFRIDGLDQEFLNPYRFLREEYLRRREQSYDYLTAICHGDLNLQNILLDEGLNVYLIDFSETRPRAAISDFARLEAIFMIDQAPIADQHDVVAMLDLIVPLYNLSGLDQPFEAQKDSDLPETVMRNIRLTQKIRSYALRTAEGNPDLFPYYMAMLEWTLPVVCYRSHRASSKLLSAAISGILCERILELDRS
ncbi:MAG: anti-sigma factor antagonist [Bacteroidales bacterium]|nr:anti-sigma factor antagonist [Bacteroidales bacterium]MDD2812146.1 anti-sigma factor antagonist [Bacteroidales bacterium]MDD3811292.1 anti-sigma factor antagonist [Bacteroidales bacterium]MDD4812168.1 anti-sigma factor antagonist [Bacteroidales bacterium]